MSHPRQRAWRYEAPIRSLLWGLCFLFVSFGSSAADVTYGYDENGRLSAVVDSTGAAAHYSYDASGNITSTSRVTAGQVSVLVFAPTHAAIGATVIITGTGFSTTPSQNTVTFNGVTASVSAATASRLTVTVPSGASTGTIGVTTPSGSASSATSFTVTTPHAPTITGFSPSSGAAGASITISGTNFDATAANDRVAFANVDTTPSSASSTSISAPVPVGATSGPIAVTTSDGTAFSSSDFFVPPASFAASDLGYTTRMTFGSSASVSLSTANKIGVIIFDAIFGQRIALKITSPSFTSSVSCKILNPDGSTLAANSCGSGGTFMGPLVVPTNGVYTILVDPSGTGTGSATLTLYDVPADASGTITAGGSAVTASTSTPGQNALLTFSGTAAHRVALKVTSVSISGGLNFSNCATIWIKNPDGSNLGSSSNPCTGQNAFLDVRTLGSSGTYTILLDPNDSATASVSMTLYDVPADGTGTITAGGSAVAVSTTTPGQKSSLTFSGTSGQLVSLGVSSVSITGGIAFLNYSDNYIKDSGGTNVGYTSAFSGSTGFIDTKTLGSTGTYTVLFDPVDASTGGATFTLYSVPADASASTTIGGSAATVTIGTPGQNGVVTFSGTASQSATVHLTSNTISSVTVTLLKPDGTTLTSASSSASSFNLSTQTLPVTGTYSIKIDPSSSSTGAISVNVTSP